MAHQDSVLAFDFGGTALKIAEVTEDGDIQWQQRIPPVHDFSRDMDNVVEVCKRRTEAVCAAGVATPGPLDYRSGEVLNAVNLSWKHVFPGQALQDRLRIPIAVENDADCAALAEATLGAARENEVVAFYGLGTGVGSGVVDNGKIFHGHFDPEFGHQIIDPNSERTCKAGHKGCLEALVSGGALERHYGSTDRIPADEWEHDVPRYLGQAIANAALFYSASCVVIGGGVVDHHPALVGKSETVMRQMLNGFLEPPTVVASALGPDMGIVGASVIAWNRVKNS